MIDLHIAAKAAKHTGINLLVYAAVCVVIAVIYMAIDTNGFTKQPSWWHVRQELGYTKNPN